MNSTKQSCIQKLIDLANLKENPFKRVAYFKACRTLKILTGKEFDERKSFLDLNNIGDGINKKILEFKDTGKIPLWDQYAMSVKSRKPNSITSVEANRIINPYLYRLRMYPNVSTAVVCGSLRRKKPYVADADILICVKDINHSKKITEEIHKWGDVKISGNVKTSILIDVFQIDFTFCTPKEWPYALLHFTGSKDFNIFCRSKAKALGLKLSQNGLFKGNELIRCRTEYNVLGRLGIPPISPERRDNPVIFRTKRGEKNVKQKTIR